MLNVDSLSFSYGGKQVLRDVSFDIGENMVVSVLGPNGVGKTTLLKCICDHHRQTTGSVKVDGVDVRSIGRRELAKKIAYVPQKAIASHTTVFDSILIGRRPHMEWSVTKHDKDVVWGAMTSLGLQDLSLSYTDAISGGEFQKVQIARAMVQEPSIIILDEPTNNLDISNQHMSMHMIVDAVRSRGISAIMTMHDINLAVHYSDRFMFIKDGTVYAYGDSSIITEELIKEVYGLDVDVIDHKGMPYVIPRTSPAMVNGPSHMHDHAHPHDVRDHIHQVYRDS